MSRYRVMAVRGTRCSPSAEPAAGFRAYAAAAARFKSAGGVVETRRAGSARLLHLMGAPTDFSRNIRVLAAELRPGCPEPTKA
jgi:hypothetical protein